MYPKVSNCIQFYQTFWRIRDKKKKRKKGELIGKEVKEVAFVELVGLKNEGEFGNMIQAEVQLCMPHSHFLWQQDFLHPIKKVVLRTSTGA